MPVSRPAGARGLRGCRAPTTSYVERPGRWAAEEGWPSRRSGPRSYRLAPGSLVEGERRSPGLPLTIQSPLSVGLFAGKWCSYAAPPDLPHDQREEDGGALVFESEPLGEALEILGAPVVELDLSSSRPVAMVAVRLSDVAPDHKATRVSYGLLNLTHHNGHEHPQALEPGARYRVRVQLNDIAQRFPPGHRVRISISTSYWPLVWPPPQSVLLAIHSGSSTLTLPVRPERAEDRELPAFAAPEGAQPVGTTHVKAGEHRWRVIRDLATDESTLEVIKNEGTIRLDDIDWEFSSETREWYTYRDDDFDSVRGETLWVRAFRRGDWSVRIVTRTVLTSDTTRFHLHAELDAHEGDERVYARNWRFAIPRDHM